ncbi:MAG TPA: hypothetical protein DEA08_19920, partial [Planctomycetes bacterium]|nr:hypothetical protein [Planctomycetota bacterium]
MAVPGGAGGGVAVSHCTAGPSTRMSRDAPDTQPNLGAQGSERACLAEPAPRRDDPFVQPVVQIGPYLVERELARGGMGVVYVARHPEWNRRVALKLILDPEAGQEIVTRFQREGEALARIQHPNVVRVYSAGHHEGRPYLALGFVEGGSLAERIPLEPRAAAELFVPLAQALAAGHAVGVLHRDLKPANVLVDPAGVPYLTDYGLASDPEREQERLTRTGTVLGTPGYMAPEQAGGEVELLGEATDVYGLGATLYAALCGVPPFKGSTVINTINAVLRDAPRPPSAHVPDLPRDLETIVLRCLEKEP